MPKINKSGDRGIENQGKYRYKTEVLLNSKELSSYQEDFVRALLTDTDYTLEEAKSILDNFFGKEGTK